MKNFIGTLTPDQGASAELGGDGNPYIDFKNKPEKDFDVRLIQTSNNTLRVLPGSGHDLVMVVDGTLKAREIEVTTNMWPDYVFKSGYKLRSLGETENYIRANGHLPGVPNASTMESEGIKLADMNRIMMEKIEELTLHMIELEKKNRLLETKLSHIGKQSPVTNAKD
jgi:hypothetical protein